MPRKCKICASPYKVEYESKYLNDKLDVLTIWRDAVREHGEQVSYPAFSRHMRNHVEKMLEIRRGVEKAREEMLGKYFQTDVEIAKKLTNHLDIIEEQIASYHKRGTLLDPEELKMVLELINSARVSFEQILKWRDRLMPKEEPTEDLATTFLEFIKDLPPDQFIMVSGRINKWVEDKRQNVS